MKSSVINFQKFISQNVCFSPFEFWKIQFHWTTHWKFDGWWLNEIWLAKQICYSPFPFLSKMLLQFYQILIVIVQEKLKFETDQFILWNSSKMFETISVDTATEMSPVCDWIDSNLDHNWFVFNFASYLKNILLDLSPVFGTGALQTHLSYLLPQTKSSRVRSGNQGHLIGPPYPIYQSAQFWFNNFFV